MCFRLGFGFLGLVYWLDGGVELMASCPIFIFDGLKFKKSKSFENNLVGLLGFGYGL